MKRAQDEGGMHGLGLNVDDCQKTYEELRAKGVEFIQPPSERPYGVEARLPRQLRQLARARGAPGLHAGRLRLMPGGGPGWGSGRGGGARPAVPDRIRYAVGGLGLHRTAGCSRSAVGTASPPP